MVYRSCAEDFSEFCKQLGHLVCLYAFACIDDVHRELLCLLVEGSDDSDEAFPRELKRVFHQVD